MERAILTTSLCVKLALLEGQEEAAFLEALGYTPTQHYHDADIILIAPHEVGTYVKMDVYLVVVDDLERIDTTRCI